MSDLNAWNGGYHADDPFAPDVVEDFIARSLRADAPEKPTAVLVRSLADAYAQPPAPVGVYVTTPGTMFLLNLSTGAIQHRYPVASGVGMPIVANGLVYGTYASPGTVWTREFDVVAVSASSGAVVWRTQTASVLQQLSLAGG